MECIKHYIRSKKPYYFSCTFKNLSFEQKQEITGETKMTGNSHGVKSYSYKRVEAVPVRNNSVYT